MVSTSLLQLLGVACLASAFAAEDGHSSYLVTTPQSAPVEVGANFTATCTTINTHVITADRLYWKLGETIIPPKYYRVTNHTTISVTFPIGGKSTFLFCHGNVSQQTFWHYGKLSQGIWLRIGYRPGKPENLSCQAVQEKFEISPNLNCTWDVVGLQTKEVPTTYTLFFTYGTEQFNVSTQANSALLFLSTFPTFMSARVWVEARNDLDTVLSETLQVEANCFVKPNPPSKAKVISEPEFPISLLMNWTHPLKEHEKMKLTYQIRFCPCRSHIWTYVPLEETRFTTESFRLQGLRPNTDYVIQLRCKNNENCGYWSEWSSNLTMRTPEDKPKTKPDIWSTVVESSVNERRMLLMSKDPRPANGKITIFNVTTRYQDKSHDLNLVPVNRSEDDGCSDTINITELKEIVLADTQSVIFKVTASNSVGSSPSAVLGIPAKSNRPSPVKNMKVWSHEGHLYLEWTVVNNTVVSEFVVQWTEEEPVWVGGGGRKWPNWQRETGSTRQTAVRGELEPFVCYNLSVFPIIRGRIRRPAQLQAFLEEGAPLRGPAVQLEGNPGKTHAKLLWYEIPRNKRQGFITNYTIFYRHGDKISAVTVPSSTTMYTLKGLTGNTRYDVWIQASTAGGSFNGSSHTFTTSRYESVEDIVVGVSLGFLFLVLLVILLCIYKRDTIKENLWPQIPDPRESTIGTWDPDYPLKAETPKENCLSGISVLDGFDEDKASLSLKKDKYLSEEHSSGIGGSSCMSSPRQSVSDSDEGADMADTTASTVQYSSVVASSSYKGQTPASLPPHAVFSRSESTQPLLDSEENPDVSLQDGGFQRFPPQPEDVDFQPLDEEQADFCAFEEDSESAPAPEGEPAEAAPASSYMPQLGGYRQQ